MYPPSSLQINSTPCEGCDTTILHPGISDRSVARTFSNLALCVSDLYSRQPSISAPLKSHPLTSAYEISQFTRMQFRREAPCRLAPRRFEPDRSAPSRICSDSSAWHQFRLRKFLPQRSHPST